MKNVLTKGMNAQVKRKKSRICMSTKSHCSKMYREINKEHLIQKTFVLIHPLQANLFIM